MTGANPRAAQGTSHSQGRAAQESSSICKTILQGRLPRGHYSAVYEEVNHEISLTGSAGRGV